MSDQFYTAEQIAEYSQPFAQTPSTREVARCISNNEILDPYLLHEVMFYGLRILADSYTQVLGQDFSSIMNQELAQAYMAKAEAEYVIQSFRDREAEAGRELAVTL